MKIFARGMKWTGVLIMVALVIVGAVKSEVIKDFLAKVPVIGDMINK